MFKRIMIMITALLAASMMCIGCVGETKYIVRSDLEFSDLKFIVRNSELRPDIKRNEVYDNMGLPYKYNVQIGGYEYFLTEEHFGVTSITFVYAGDWVTGIDLEATEEEPTLADLIGITKRSEREKSGMPIRNDISLSELDFIRGATLVSEVQRALGAPHDYLEPGEVQALTIAYIYPLIDGNELRIAYEYGGVIVKAWVVDKEGNELQVLVDRTDIYGTVDDE